MKALVTGGAGFIGSNLAHELVRLGWDVRVLDNLSSGHAGNLADLPAVELVEGDVRDDAAVARAMADREIVFHLAASVGNKRSIDDPLGDADINVMGTLKVLQAARNAGVRKIVASSSAGIFGELKTLPIAEDHPLEPITPYGASKLCMEKQCLASAHVFGLEAVCLRYFNVYGRNQRLDPYGNVIPIFVFNALEGRPIQIYGDGLQTRDFVNVRDVVQANIRAATAAGVSGAFNIASATQVRILDLVALIRAHLPVPFQVEHVGKRAGDVEHSLADIGKARRLLGYIPQVDIEPGIIEYLAWAVAEVGARTAASSAMARGTTDV